MRGTTAQELACLQGELFWLRGRLKLKTKFIGTNYKKEIVVPPYVKNISRVVIWCAFAAVNLGEAKFSSPVK